MTTANLFVNRLRNQHVTGKPLRTPAEVVSWLGAVQSQDYPAAKWAVAQRTLNATDAALDEAFDSGAIVRTHVMRPTWHFVAPADIRWLLALTAPRVDAICRSYYRKFDLTDAVFAQSHAALVSALQGGRHLTRTELGAVLRKARVLRPDDTPMRLGFVMMRAELDAVVCSGPRRGKQFTYALLDERIPPVRALTRDQALAELVRRFFTSHGPAAVRDFAWWSGLTVADTKAGLDAVKSSLVEATVNGTSYWGPRGRRAPTATPSGAYLLPAYDEALLAYRDNRVDLGARGPQVLRDNGQIVVIDGRSAGTWRRTINAKAVAIEATPFVAFDTRDTAAITAAAKRYGRFMNMPVDVVFGRMLTRVGA
jgi:hypothetical protein